MKKKTKEFDIINAELEKINSQLGNHMLIHNIENDTIKKTKRKKSSLGGNIPNKKTKSKSSIRVPLAQIYTSPCENVQSYESLGSTNQMFSSTLEFYGANGVIVDTQKLAKKSSTARIQQSSVPQPKKKRSSKGSVSTNKVPRVRSNSKPKQQAISKNEQPQKKASSNPIDYQVPLNIITPNFQMVPSLNFNHLNNRPFDYQVQVLNTSSSIRTNMPPSDQSRMQTNNSVNSQPTAQQEQSIYQSKRNNNQQSSQEINYKQSREPLMKVAQNRNEIDRLFEEYQKMCNQLDNQQSLFNEIETQRSQSEFHQSNNEEENKFQDKIDAHTQDNSHIPDVLIANFNEAESDNLLSQYDDLSINEDLQSDEESSHQKFEESHFIQKHVNDQASVQNLAKNRGVYLYSSESYNLKEDNSQSLSGNHNNLLEETKNEEEYFMINTQQQISGNDLPYQESVDSYNTADFTKFSIGELSKKQFLTQMNLMRQSGEANNRMRLMEEGLVSAIKIIISLSRNNQIDESETDLKFFDQLEEVNTLESIVDILKFIETDKDTLLLRQPKILEILEKSIPMIFQTTRFQSPSFKTENQSLDNNLASPNLSALTPIRVINQQPELVQYNGRNIENHAHLLTLRNHEIFEDQQIQHISNQSNLMSETSVTLPHQYDNSILAHEQEDSMQIGSIKKGNNYYKREQFFSPYEQSVNRREQDKCEIIDASQIQENDFQSSINDCSFTQQDLTHFFFKQQSKHEDQLSMMLFSSQKPETRRIQDYIKNQQDDNLLDISENHQQFEISQISYQKSEIVNNDNEDGRIMAYLEKDIQPNKDSNKVIDKALSNFMGGFTELKSEITQLQKNVTRKFIA